MKWKARQKLDQIQILTLAGKQVKYNKVANCSELRILIKILFHSSKAIARHDERQKPANSRAAYASAEADWPVGLW